MTEVIYIYFPIFQIWDKALCLFQTQTFLHQGSLPFFHITHHLAFLCLGKLAIESSNMIVFSDRIEFQDEKLYFTIQNYKLREFRNISGIL